MAADGGGVLLMNRILVTGAGGYIGSRVVQTLRNAGFEVLATARREESRLAGELGVDVRRLDVLAPGAFSVPGRLDAIVHCATANDIVSRDFSQGVDLSVCGTWRMLDFARAAGARHFIFLSTFQVYGTELSGSISEETPVSCETPYGLNHWFGEEACRLFSRTHGLPCSILRPSNVYGAPTVSTVERSTLVPMCFVREALTTGRITIRSSGKQRRNFVSSAEVAGAAQYLLTEPEPADCRVFNVCSNLTTSIADVAELTCRVYEEHCQKPIALDILGNDPATGNSFQASSCGGWVVPTEESSRQCMTAEILQLFQQATEQPNKKTKP
jgi:UDP-glucose 4-epimerase